MSTSKAMNSSPIFIVGCPRSGTGMLRNLLRSHPNITFPPESHFIPGLYKAYGDPETEREARKLARIILNLFWVRSWGLSLEPTTFSHFRSYKEIISRIYEEFARQENKPRWGDKTPEYITDIPILLRLFPLAKIIHIFRDGRDVALSWVPFPHGPKNLFTAAHVWQRRVEVGRRIGKRLSDDTYYEIKYEDLLISPKKELKSLCTFLDEDFDEQMLKPNFLKRRAPKIISGGTIASMAAKSKIVTGNHGKWKREMDKADRIMFESIAGDLLKSLGYETEGLHRRIPKVEQLGWKLHHFVRIVIKRLNAGDKKDWMSGHLVMKWASLRSYMRFGD